MHWADRQRSGPHLRHRCAPDGEPPTDDLYSGHHHDWANMLPDVCASFELESHPSVAVYTPALLAVYDTLVL